MTNTGVRQGDSLSTVLWKKFLEKYMWTQAAQFSIEHGRYWYVWMI
jgi:hypothetical protein